MLDRAFMFDRLAEVQRSLARAQRSIHRQRTLTRALEFCRLRYAAARSRRTLEDIEAVHKWLTIKQDLLARELMISAGVPPPAVVVMPEAIGRVH
jgi:hypothetical protein